MQLTRKQFFASLAALPLAAKVLPLPEAQEPNGRRLRSWQMWSKVTGIAFKSGPCAELFVPDGKLFAVGDLFVIPSDPTLCTPPEMCRVYEVCGNLIKVDRDVNRTGTNPIEVGSDIRIIGNYPCPKPLKSASNPAAG